MRIGILVTIASGFGKKGFYQSQEIGLAKVLKKRGHQVSVYKYVRNDNQDSSPIIDGMLVHYIRSWSFGIHGYISSQVIPPNLDCLFCFADTQLFLPHIIRYCDKNGILFIPYVGIGHSAQQNLKSKFLDAAFHATTLKYYKGRTVFAKTPEAAEEFRKLGIENVKVVPVGLDIDALKTDFEEYDRDIIRMEFDLEPQDIVISFVARMKIEKRPIEMVKLFSLIKKQDPDHSYKLIMVGKGPLYEKVVEEAVKEGLTEDIRLYEEIPYEDIWKIHYASDYFINLRRNEIFGMALIEAVYYLSSVCAVHSAGPDLILDGREGHLLCSGGEFEETANEISEWVKRGIPDKSLLKRNADDLVKDFSWEFCAKEIETIVENRC